MISPEQLPENVRAVYPWSGSWLQVEAGRMHYLDEGPRDAPVLLALHGNPTWSFYWRALVRRFAGRYRVVVPDHIGCGLSDKPQGWPYRLSGHIDNVVRLIDHLDLRRITFVLHDWGGAIGMGAAEARADRAARFVVTNTAAFRSSRIPASIASCRIPGFGALAVRGCNGFARAAIWRAPARPLPAEARAGLLLPYDSWANRIATLRFVEDIPMKPDHPSYPTLAAVEQGLAALAHLPMLIVWGEQDWCFTPEFREEWQRRFPSARCLPLDRASHYLLEDEPDAVLDAMEGFFGDTRAAEGSA